MRRPFVLPTRQIIKVVLDWSVWVVAAPVAYALRLEAGVVDVLRDITLYTVAAGVLKAVVIVRSQHSDRSWHRVGLRDMLPLLALVLLVAVVESAVAWSAAPVFIPRSVPLIEALLAAGGLAGLRFAARIYYEERGVRPGVDTDVSDAPQRVLVVGAGDAGTLIAREMLRHPEHGRRPVGFLDDDPAKASKSFLGIRVLGTVDDLAPVVESSEADEVLIAMPSASGGQVRRVVEAARTAGVQHRIIPGLFDLASGRVTASEIREVDLEDLLRREPVRLDRGPIAAYLSGQTVLVTGAGGSIGSEIVRQVAAVGPACLVLLGRGENSVFEIDRELGRTHPGIDRHAVVCDVRDGDSLQDVFERFRPDVVFHAAAHKHVPLMEANPAQAIFNNVGGTRNVVTLALAHGVSRVVNVSTDKAVNPTNVMGASKRVAELVVSDAARQCAEGQAVMSVRFGNVLGSRGSVVPFFREQIRRGGPVTVTHADMVRYFMTIPEASQLVLQAGAIACNGQVYVLDMGDPVRIVDLARDLILLSGYTPDEDIQIVFTGTRPGEKLFEELLTAEDGVEPSPHPKLFVARQPAPPDLENELDTLFSVARVGSPEDIRAALGRLVPTYRPAQTLEAVVSGGDGASAAQVEA
ncbi:MAG: nucleoside-diphosphate sugar epimerase/dehydratase [Bacteroidota bacterium]